MDFPTDPAVVHGTLAGPERAFLDTAIAIKRRLELLVAPPMDALDRMALQSRLKDIGTEP
ncbi:MAG: hypothetical protein GX573_19670 [Chloroflexi bacterium]|mgnify:FL=1|jgi:arsenate reductase|nr:hypothetical protein [Chloroflexota bacterium]